MRLASFTSIALVAALAAPALAQPGVTPPSTEAPAYPTPAPQGYPAPTYAPSPYAPVYAQPVVTAPRKSEATATWLSIGATALGLGAIALGGESRNEALAWAGVAGVFVGPSAGHIYAGEGGHAVKMSLLRAGGVVVLAVGALSAHSEPACIDYCGYDDDDSEANAAIWLGGALFVGATLYDFWDAGRAARRYNEKHQASYMFAPTMMSSPHGAAPGLSLAGQF